MMETPESSVEKREPGTLPETVSVRGNTPATEPQKLADQLLPPIDDELREEWERHQREKKNKQD